MGRKCSVEGCLSDSNRPEDAGVTFHKVPPHIDVRPKWLSLCRIPDDKKLIKVIYICSRHFLRADFCNFKGKKYMLRQGVLPSVFPWDKSKLEAIKAEAKKEKSPEVKQESNRSSIKKENDYTSNNEEALEGGEKDENQIALEEIKVEPEEKSDESEENKLSDSLSFTINSRIEALDFNNEWFPARIVEVDYEENEVLIHFEKFSSKYDEWISMNSSRLRPLQPQIPNNTGKKGGPFEQFSVGERCLAAWSDSRKFPATVTKVMQKDMYEVLFDDGFVKNLKAHRMSKTHGKPLQASPLFDPIKSSKQDRREKKRKLNVAALFRKRPRMDHKDDKLPKSQSSPAQETQMVSESSAELPIDSMDLDSTAPEIDIENWKPSWIKGKPVGISSTIVTQDGPKVSVIVPDPRLPEGWKKHLTKRTKGTDAGKWDTIIVSPDNKRFRSRTDILKYLEDHPCEGVTLNMFDFSLVPRRKKKVNKVVAPVKPPDPEPPAPEVYEEPVAPEEPDVKEEENANYLKILFEDDAYKCPIEGCGKAFRRENLAQMHVKHYHPEFTKFLDSTPNVADLAYARTVEDNLDRSPGPAKPAPLKPAQKSTTPKLPKQSDFTLEDIFDSKSSTKSKPPSTSTPKFKDAEIIKLLNAKPFDKKETEPIQPLPSGLPTNMYPDIKLKDLLNKAESVPRRDDINLKTLCSTRPPAGIKTLLPVVRQPPAEASSVSGINNNPESTPKHPGRRKRSLTENIEFVKGKDSPQPQQQQHTTTSHPPYSSPFPPTPISMSSQSQPPPNHSTIQHFTLPQQSEIQPSDLPNTPNNVIIEGGEVIKIVRMKQEEIINCTCGFTEEDGLMIQCELCLCWQHANCNNIERESQVPEKYVCYICQNPLRERLSRKYYHDQDWLKQGTLPVGSYHARDDEVLHKRFEKLKKCHDLSGGIMELKEYLHNLSVKIKIAEAKNHPKLYLWSKPWDKQPLPEKAKQEDDNVKPKLENQNQEYLKSEMDVDKDESQNEQSMLMMILRGEGGKDVIPKIDLNSLMDTNEPIIPQAAAAVDLSDCRLNLLEHIVHQESLVEERLDDFEKQIEALEQGGQYKCVAENVAGKTEMAVELMVTTKPRILVHPTSVSVDENEESALHCDFESDARQHTVVKWRKDGKYLKHDYDDETVSHQRIKVFKHNGTLVIRNTQAGDRGEYICEVVTMGQEPILSKPATISVIEQLRFVPAPVNKKMELGSVAKIHCKAQGTPPPIIRWEKEGIPAENLPSHITDMNGTLHFNGVTTADKGRYNCIASNSQGVINASINIEVVVAPKFSILPKSPTEVIEGQPVSIDCVVEGDPKPTIQWDKNLKMNNFDLARFKVLENGTLFISEVHKEDENKYGCTAGSSAGLNRKEVQLIVHTQEGLLPEADGDSTVTKAVLITMSVAGAYIVLVIGLMVWCRYRRRSRKLPLGDVGKTENGDIEHTELKEALNGNGSTSSKPKSNGIGNHKEGQRSDGAETTNSQSSNNSKKSKSSYDKLALSRSHLKDIKLIGRGEFGDIMIAKIAKSILTQNKRASRNSQVASSDEQTDDKDLVVMVKALSQTKDEGCLMEFKREMDMFSKISHENVTKLFGLCREAEPHFMILEYSDWGDLKKFLLATQSDNSPPLTPVQSIGILHQLSCGMDHLASNRMVHKDLAARNCSISSILVAKIGLPRLTRDPYSQEYCKHANQIIPLRWLPYEAVYEDEYSTKSDVYSFGVLIWEVFAKGELPHSKINDNSFLTKLKEKKLEWSSHSSTPEPLIKFQESCWDLDPQKRPSFSDLKKELSDILKSM